MKRIITPPIASLLFVFLVCYPVCVYVATSAVPCDAQAGQMQPRKLTLEQRVERLEKRIEDHERRLTPTPAEIEK